MRESMTKTEVEGTKWFQDLHAMVFCMTFALSVNVEQAQVTQLFGYGTEILGHT